MDDEEDAELTRLLENGSGPAGAGDDSESDDDKEAEKKETKKKEQEEQDAAEVGNVEKQKNWSSVNVAANESKLNFRGCLSKLNFTNWLWYRCVRPKLEETKAKLPELDADQLAKYGIDDVEEIFGEY